MRLARVIDHELRLSYALNAQPIVFVVDEDSSVRESLKSLISRGGWQCETFASAHEFLISPWPVVPSCLVLNVSLPDLNGLDLQKRVAVARPNMSIIFMTGQPDVYTSVRAMKAGAIEFLLKPFGEDTLLGAIQEGIKRSCAELKREAEVRTLRDSYAQLSHREQQVMALVASGLLNKQVGAELGISEITVKAHRGQVMQKMKADTFADLVRMAARLRLERALSSHPSVQTSGRPQTDLQPYYDRLSRRRAVAVRHRAQRSETCGEPSSKEYGASFSGPTRNKVLVPSTPRH
jgi:FixJ family two-component response regulator